MIRADMIPDEVVEAAAKAAYENQRTRKWDRCGYVGQQQLRRDARAAIAAAINAWTGAGIEEYVNGDRGIFLPLPQGAAAPLEPREEGNYDYAGGL